MAKRAERLTKELNVWKACAGVLMVRNIVDFDGPSDANARRVRAGFNAIRKEGEDTQNKFLVACADALRHLHEDALCMLERKEIEPPTVDMLLEMEN